MATIMCEDKAQYFWVYEAEQACSRTNYGDDLLEPYYCKSHSCLHIGHARDGVLVRRYSTWKGAIKATINYQNQMAKPLKMRIFKKGAFWRVELVTPRTRIIDVRSRKIS